MTAQIIPGLENAGNILRQLAFIHPAKGYQVDAALMMLNDGKMALVQIAEGKTTTAAEGDDARANYNHILKVAPGVTEVIVAE